MKTEDLIYGKIREGKEQDNVIPLRTEIIDICDGSIPAAIMLTQLIYWTDRAPKQNWGWIWKSGTEWYKETRLTEQNVKTALAILTSKALVETKNTVARGHNTRWFRILLVEITNALAKITSALVESTNSEQSLSEPTTEITFNEENSKTIEPVETNASPSSEEESLILEEDNISLVSSLALNSREDKISCTLKQDKVLSDRIKYFFEQFPTDFAYKLSKELITEYPGSMKEIYSLIENYT